MSDLLKAVAVDGDPDMMYGYVPITKMDDSQRMVYGIISGPEVDLDGQVVDQDWLKEALPKWMLYGNIRAQHDPKRPVGKAVELDLTHPDGPWMGARIVDDAAWKLCKEGVYSGFSVGIKGPQILKDPQAPNGRVRGRAVCEVSVVDHPSYYKAKMALVKSVGNGSWLDAQTGVVLDPMQSATPKEEKMAQNDTPQPQPQAPQPQPNQPIQPGQGQPIADPNAPTAPTAPSVPTAPTLPPSAPPSQPQTLPQPAMPPDVARQIEQHTAMSTEAGATDAGTQKAAEPDVMKGPHAHHHMLEDGHVRHSMHHHSHMAHDAYDGAPYAEHRHCPICGDDTRVCGHGSGKGSLMKKDAEPDVTKASAEFVQVERADTIAPGNPSNAKDTLLKDAAGLIAQLMAAVSGSNSVGFNPMQGDKSQSTVTGFSADEANYVGDAAQQWHGRPSHTIKAASIEPMDWASIVRPIINDELTKLFSGDGLLTKAASADTQTGLSPTVQAFKEAVEALAAEKAATLTSSLEERLAKVEAQPLPAKGVSMVAAIEKSFNLNPSNSTPPQRRMAEADVVGAVQKLDDDTQKKVAAAVISEMYRQGPMLPPGQAPPR